jgi:hypothetical protein
MADLSVILVCAIAVETCALIIYVGYNLCRKKERPTMCYREAHGEANI